MKKIFILVLLAASCGADSPWMQPMPPWPIVASDDDHRFCSHEYPVDSTPESCESSSWGDCCSWEGVETEDGVCRLDYCAAYEDPQCSWSLQYQDCEEE